MTKSRGVLLVLLVAGILWAISLASWQTGAAGQTLGPSGVVLPDQDETLQASPVTTACVAIVAVCGLLAAMFGRIGRFVILGLALLAALGYGITAITALGSATATRWPLVALVASVLAVVVIGWVLVASRAWAGSNRYALTAEAGDAEFDSAATWDALSRGDEVESEDADEADDAGEADGGDAGEADGDGAEDSDGTGDDAGETGGDAGETGGDGADDAGEADGDSADDAGEADDGAGDAGETGGNEPKP